MGVRQKNKSRKWVERDTLVLPNRILNYSLRGKFNSCVCVCVCVCAHTCMHMHLYAHVLVRVF